MSAAASVLRVSTDSSQDSPTTTDAEGTIHHHGKPDRQARQTATPAMASGNSKKTL
ncbi:MAG: hypothetical protein ACXVJ3_19855 [Ilumatobacteraceae bacterium]